MQIPKAQKDNQLKQLFALSGSAGIKALRKHIDEIDPKFKRQTAPSYSDITEMERLCSRSGTIRERPKLVFLSFFEKKCKKKFRLKIFQQRVWSNINVSVIEMAQTLTAIEGLIQKIIL